MSDNTPVFYLHSNHKQSSFIIYNQSGYRNALPVYSEAYINDITQDQLVPQELYINRGCKTKLSDLVAFIQNDDQQTEVNEFLNIEKTQFERDTTSTVPIPNKDTSSSIASNVIYFPLCVYSLFPIAKIWDRIRSTEDQGSSSHDQALSDLWIYTLASITSIVYIAYVADRIGGWNFFSRINPKYQKSVSVLYGQDTKITKLSIKDNKSGYSE